jgi:hypothetical protein
MIEKRFQENVLCVRIATLDDAPLMSDIYYHAMEKTCGYLPKDIRKEAVDLQTNYQVSYLLEKDNHVLVTHKQEQPKEIISYAIFKKNKYDIFVSDLYAKPNKLGAGTTLITEIANIAVNEDKKFIAVHALPDARRFYFKNHFIDEPLIHGMIRPIDPVSQKSISYHYVKKFLGHLIP